MVSGNLFQTSIASLFLISSPIRHKRPMEKHLNCRFRLYSQYSIARGKGFHHFPVEIERTKPSLLFFVSIGLAQPIISISVNSKLGVGKTGSTCSSCDFVVPFRSIFIPNATGAYLTWTGMSSIPRFDI